MGALPENRVPKNKVALASLRVVREYVARLREAQWQDAAALVRSARVGRALIEEASLPTNVRKETQLALDDFLDFVWTVRLDDDKKSAQERERLSRDAERRKKENNAFVGKILITLVCVALGFVLAFKGAAPWVCALVYVVLYVWGEKEPLLRAVDAISKFCSNK